MSVVLSPARLATPVPLHVLPSTAPCVAQWPDAAAGEIAAPRLAMAEAGEPVGGLPAVRQRERARRLEPAGDRIEAGPERLDDRAAVDVDRRRAAALERGCAGGGRGGKDGYGDGRCDVAHLRFS
ncbi:MAG: hypothetical protein J0H54_13785 [Rhizobiales bacterium]|nr:hypothetical protein [Hyphomicrobiales bacterium]